MSMSFEQFHLNFSKRLTIKKEKKLPKNNKCTRKTRIKDMELFMQTTEHLFGIWPPNDFEDERENHKKVFQNSFDILICFIIFSICIFLNFSYVFFFSISK